MWDLTVSDVHTFAVGEGQWVVHNCNSIPPIAATGKVKGPLPSHPPTSWTREQLYEFADDLRNSIRTRQQEMLDLGESTARGPSHRTRINDEIVLLRQIEKVLSGS